MGGRNFWNPKQLPLENPHTDLLRHTPSELQHQGSSLKGTSSIKGGNEVSGIKVGAGGQLSLRQKGGQRPLSLFRTCLCPPEPQSQEVGAIYETPSTWLTLFAQPRRSPKTLFHPTYGPTKATFPYEWLVLAHVSQLPNSSHISNSWPQ